MFNFLKPKPVWRMIGYASVNITINDDKSLKEYMYFYDNREPPYNRKVELTGDLDEHYVKLIIDKLPTVKMWLDGGLLPDAVILKGS